MFTYAWETLENAENGTQLKWAPWEYTKCTHALTQICTSLEVTACVLAHNHLLSVTKVKTFHVASGSPSPISSQWAISCSLPMPTSISKPYLFFKVKFYFYCGIYTLLSFIRFLFLFTLSFFVTSSFFSIMTPPQKLCGFYCMILHSMVIFRNSHCIITELTTHKF